MEGENPQEEIEQLPNGIVVVRGGPMTDTYLDGHAAINHELLQKSTSGIRRRLWESNRAWVLCVAAAPDLTADELAARWPYRGRSMRESTTDKLGVRGFEVVADRENPKEVHALLVLPTPPSKALWSTLRGCFDDQRPNPAYRRGN